jgi:dUTP pyrophosphatase
MTEDNENLFDKELDDLNKVIQSANQLVQQMGGSNPLAILQQQITEMNNKQSPTFPVIQNNNLTVILHCINKSNNPPPKFEKDGDSGFDLRANLEQPIIIKSMTMETIPTGLFLEVPNGYEVQVRSRSGLARKNQVFVMNQPGTVDSGYRGEVLVMLFNLGKNDIQINHGDRVAQGVVCPVIGSGKLTILETTNLSESERGTGGFGHTGNK